MHPFCPLKQAQEAQQSSIISQMYILSGELAPHKLINFEWMMRVFLPFQPQKCQNSDYKLLETQQKPIGM